MNDLAMQENKRSVSASALTRAMQKGIVAIEKPEERGLTFTNLELALAQAQPTSQRRACTAAAPLHDNVLVLVCAKDEMTENGLFYVPGVAQERQSEGIVIAAGPGRVDANNVFRPTSVRPFDRVLFGRYAGMEQRLRGKECRLMSEAEILEIIR